MADDDELQARLEALKKPSGVAQSGQRLDDDSDELVKRFLRFHSSSPPLQHQISDHGSLNEDGKSLKELLANIPSAKDWNVDATDEKNIEKLLVEAQKMLPDKDEAEHTSKSHESVEDRDPLAETNANADPNNDLNEDAEADEALQQILDELDGEDSFLSLGVADSNPREGLQAAPVSPQTEKDTGAPFELPSAPSAEPLLSSSGPDSNNADSSGLVDLPSAPTVKPSVKVLKTQSNLPVYTNEDIDSWCVICNEDATVRCIGCEGDLYCANCWKEGHMSPDAGLDERQHRWAKYRRDKKS